MSRSCPESAQGSKSYPDPNHSLKNTLPWDRPPWGSGDHKANDGKSGPQSSPPCSYTNDHNAPSQGPVLLLPVLASTIPVLLQLPACTHSGQRPPSVPQVPPVALVQRRALPSMPMTLQDSHREILEIKIFRSHFFHTLPNLQWGHL